MVFFDQTAHVFRHNGSKDFGQCAEKSDRTVGLRDFIVWFAGFSENDCGEVLPWLIVGSQCKDGLKNMQEVVSD